ncbi:hypothetical protein COJ37_13620 [Bacillus cereus]|uniref:dCTP deaminase domain-containing protein n=1 Tax=Bacillus cereus group TaxID=86661 RepID=UPI000BF2CD4B|nr:MULTISPECIES: hypothetical protein [Bacillus cereus group]MEB9858624.1 hypothetical protein [Bacillus cereus]MEB9875936.1 hypothetical protein [Bacillus cereus]NRR14089.1 hypothetical protein [Bacillus pacificus]PEX19855.1 hypothetical protein CN452_12140 [Bacillus cereus]PFM00584.1 hypothetical protein COJ37_13620 [Bacillus cereus]
MLLSNNDIKRELIKGNIRIHPLNMDNIKGGSINLTASQLAWRVSDKNSAVKDNIIEIPPNDTVCIYTNEAIWVSKWIGGTYHPRVSLVSKGLGHISTTLDPGWAGLSLIAVNNPTNKAVSIIVGESLVSIMLYYLKTPSSLNTLENTPSRPDIAKTFNLSSGEDLFLQEQWHRNEQGISGRMLKSESYKEFYKEENAEIIKKEQDKKKFKETFKYPLSIAIIGAVLGAILGSALSTYLASLFLK